MDFRIRVHIYIIAYIYNFIYVYSDCHIYNRNWLDDCSQRVAVQGLVSKWRPVMSGIPQSLVLGSELFNVFVSSMNSGIECTLSKFANDTKLSCVVNMLKG